MLPEHSNDVGSSLLSEAVLVGVALAVVVWGCFSAVPWFCALPLPWAVTFGEHTPTTTGKQLLEGKL